MRRRNLVIGLVLFGLALMASAHNIAAQQPKGSIAEQKQPLRRVKKQSGWRIPGREEFQTVSRLESVSFKEVTVIKKTFTGSSQPLVDAEGYFMISNGELLITHVLCEVKELYSYELNGHVFAYESWLQLVSVDMQGRRQRTGAMFHSWYYDNDGGGRFESRIGATELEGIPEWVKRKAADPDN